MKAVARVSRLAAPRVALRALARPALATPVRWLSAAKAAEEDVDLESLTVDELAEFMAVQEASHKAKSVGSLPVRVHPVVAPVVQSVYAAAKTPANLSAVHAELTKFLATVKAEADVVSRFFETRTSRAEVAKAAMDVLFNDKVKKFEDIADAEVREEVLVAADYLPTWLEARAAVKALKLSPLAKQAIDGVVALGQPVFIRDVAVALAAIAEAESTVANVTVNSAVALTDAQKKEIEASLTKFLPKGKATMTVEFAVNKDIVGGLLVHIDNSIIDLSTQTYFTAAAAAAAAGARA